MLNSCVDQVYEGLRSQSNPLDTYSGNFLATYLYGIVEPKTGASFFFEFSHLNTDCFQVFLNLVAEQFKDDLLIIQLDNGGSISS
ncbi:hypothetical protein H6F43_16205 [Leptolyngbya sp. FACHB-36]|uniref:hypothetical protein n=1 Tax=Leptolyngbya sp. FACHB-36 TaxID=2692808 RepID=UPI001681B4CC|nr:hypothetical protein [Leptolyngbya sp. FACHB-36]MBD2021724.1 hypothetical protein [Leptolyngbya sp. FACHB-36]